MIVGIGELLWDLYPDGRRVAGGAPFNFAFHCQQLGHESAIVSRVGNDDLGRELRDCVRSMGVRDDWIQTDGQHPTGIVRVALDANKVPTYAIAENAAWDFIEWDGPLAGLSHDASSANGYASSVRAICFGSLAQRSPKSRSTIHRVVENASLTIFDVNLRLRFYAPESLKTSLTASHWVKINEEELTVLEQLQSASWRNVYEGLTEVCFHGGEWPHVSTRGILTRGSNGCVVVDWSPEWDESIGGNRYSEDWAEEPAAAAKVVDTVGAGDAFTAAMVCLHLEGRPLADCARFANYYAARVCEHRGATPKFDRATIERAAFGEPNR
ncbi:MAG TPA: carbohydrate kinase [Gemmataceae bacterium]